MTKPDESSRLPVLDLIDATDSSELSDKPLATATPRPPKRAPPKSRRALNGTANKRSRTATQEETATDHGRSSRASSRAQSAGLQPPPPKQHQQRRKHRLAPAPSRLSASSASPSPDEEGSPVITGRAGQPSLAGPVPTLLLDHMADTSDIDHEEQEPDERDASGQDDAQEEAEGDEEEEVEEEDEPDGKPASYASDDQLQRVRLEAIEDLVKIEINFASLRDQLYVERMHDVKLERDAIDSGTHPELTHVNKIISARRERRIELAQRWQEAGEAEQLIKQESSERAVWTWWSDKRAELKRALLQHVNGKRRKLDREKRSIERPFDMPTEQILQQHGPSYPRLMPMPDLELPESFRESDHFTIAELSTQQNEEDLRAMGFIIEPRARQRPPRPPSPIRPPGFMQPPPQHWSRLAPPRAPAYDERYDDVMSSMAPTLPDLHHRDYREAPLMQGGPLTLPLLRSTYQ
ncbi:uncharacterized protein L969DRAFT_53794 [Mixia osmundae IAM 14324]|uniref:uncharacterized protein n=1 Tax=Mixia osmundae (strain CBS 9802 / IAM 14324 / JCM 22182 / KY 12970) TaxID=764103 RepID=UPI0004A558B4|nr:uncharacterized protein L969DRAFT_53794 [Mixia osmundae IAM 14324]KEI37087.1 hypothetical protein L969DRAFT_53794 [Mixia osmundae IAM 14324]